jgi:SHS2 domain-containing protein
MPYEIVDHTADLAFRVRAGSLKELFEEAARSLFSEILDSVDTVRPREKEAVVIDAPNREELLVEWLRELLFRFDAEGKVYSRFKVEISDAKLKGEVYGEELDPERHKVRLIVKGITYHMLSIRETEEGFEATFLVDI